LPQGLLASRPPCRGMAPITVRHGVCTAHVRCPRDAADLMRWLGDKHSSEKVEDSAEKLKQKSNEKVVAGDMGSQQYDLPDDKKRASEHSSTGVVSSSVGAKELTTTLEQGKGALNAGTHALGKSVTETTGQCKRENAEFMTLAASDTGAKEVLAVAKNRMSQIYNPKLFKSPVHTCTEFADWCDDRLKNSGSAIKTYRGEVEEATGDIAKLKAEMSDIQGHIKRVDEELAVAKVTGQQKVETVEFKADDIANLQAEMADIQARMKQADDQLRETVLQALRSARVLTNDTFAESHVPLLTRVAALEQAAERAEMAGIQAQMKAEMASIQAQMKAEITNLEAEIGEYPAGAVYSGDQSEFLEERRMLGLDKEQVKEVDGVKEAEGNEASATTKMAAVSKRGMAQPRSRKKKQGKN